MVDGAFQTDAFQNDAFQVDAVQQAPGVTGTDQACSGTVTATDEENPG